MKRNYISFGIIILLIAVTLIAFREPDAEAVELNNLENENENLLTEISHLEESIEASDNKVEELKSEKQQLTEVLSQLEGEVEALKESKHYDFTKAIETVESYKQAETFEEASESILHPVQVIRKNAEDCPCAFVFGPQKFDWIPDLVLDLKEYTIKKDSLLLSYNASEKVNEVYEFVMVKEDEWKIKEINIH
ncbi:hypothetical protein [Evansella clarkii]|uniref:hypothetical protein n=1 Tax=Evansella clarkii TaxID=79879 RepID=UPI000B44BB48|nr:hypothetical protein [Evansella clarkii]